MSSEIAYQNYDLVFKDSFSLFQEHTLDFLGLELPRITGILDAKEAEITARENRFDLVFALEDGRILHMEEERAISREDLRRFAAYDLKLYNKYHKPIETLVLTPQKRGETQAGFDIGSLRYKVTVYSTKRLKAEEVLRKIEAEARRGAEVNPLQLIFTPLMESEKETLEIIKETVEITKNLRLGAEVRKKIIVSLLVLSDKFVDRDILEGIWREISMYKFIEFAEEKGIEKGMRRGMERGMEKGLERGMEKGLERGMEKGLAKGRQETLLQSVTKLLLKKFKRMPPAYIQKISGLSSIQLELILDDIFDIQSLNDLEKYLPES